MTPPQSDSHNSLRLPPLTNAGGGPLYEQIVHAIKREISAGRLKPGAALPSFRALAEDLLVSLITVKRAYEDLEREGIIYCRQGLGTFVADDGDTRTQASKKQNALHLLTAALAEAREAGLSEEEILQIVQTRGRGEKSWKPKR